MSSQFRSILSADPNHPAGTQAFAIPPPIDTGRYLSEPETDSFWDTATNAYFVIHVKEDRTQTGGATTAYAVPIPINKARHFQTTHCVTDRTITCSDPSSCFDRSTFGKTLENSFPGRADVSLPLLEPLTGQVVPISGDIASIQIVCEGPDGPAGTRIQIPVYSETN